MCGIIGFVADERLDTEALMRARARIAHRGPDDAGAWCSPPASASQGAVEARVGLAHTRLSIVDLTDAGHQPLGNEDGTVRIVYNGEVYNAVELRRDLEAAGHVFRSRTDTEVIVHAYEQWGPGCVERLRGMFAFGIWDDGRKQLFLARDRIGIKPLFYYWDGSSFAFASEIKAIATLPGLDLATDETGLYDFLTYGYVPTPKTAHVKVRKLPPAHTLTFNAPRRALSVSSYWDVRFDGSGPKSEGEAIEAIRHQLREATADHMVSDVPVGLLLSGGVDSSAVAAFANALSQQPLRTYSIGFDVEAHSETRFARMVATHLGTIHTEAVVSQASAAETTRLLSELYDEPFGDSSAIPTLAVSRLARHDVKVALSGDGGDEVFGGYESYARHRRRRHFAAVPSVFRHHLPAMLERSGFARLRGVPTLTDGLRPDLERHVVIQGGFTRAQKEHFLRKEVLHRYRDYDDLWAFRRHWRPELSGYARLQYLDLKTYLPDDILTKVDRASMAVALELRPPLLDHRLIELVGSLPERVRTPNGSLKHIFKAALRGLLPDTILDRPKKGFSVPLGAWLASLTGGPTRHGSDSQTWLLHLLQGWTNEHGVQSLRA
jgi:asparagine synthase (glutamine-hydrolysing)